VITASNPSPAANFTNRIVIKDGYEGVITLHNVQMTLPANYSYGANPTYQYNAIDIESGAKVTLKLMGESKIQKLYTTFTSSGRTVSYDYEKAIIHVPQGAFLTIESYNGSDADGKLTVIQSLGGNSGRSGAAIGSNYQETPKTTGHITINSGTVDVTGGDDAAAIGGGQSCSGGDITINGGIVRALSDAHLGSSNSGAGIGSGHACSDLETRIRINDGEVTAGSFVSNSFGACGSAIGAGNGGTAGFEYIIIAGGKIKASVRGFDINDNPVDMYNGLNGVGIGGGANSNAPGTIIILPSADVSQVIGDKATSGWDIGNCQQLFYLNKAPLRVAVAGGGVKQTRIFTARTGDSKVGADIYARIYMADTYLEAVASKMGATKHISDTYGGISGLTPGIGDTPTDSAYYFTNGKVDFFTGAKTPSNQPYEIVTRNNSDDTPNASEPYNNNPTNDLKKTPYNVILPIETGATYDFQLSDYWDVDGGTVQPLNGSLDTIDLNFGTSEYRRLAIYQAPDTLAHAIGIPSGNQWMKVEVASTSTVESFELAGPVVAPAEVEGGSHLPVGTVGTVTIRAKERIPVGVYKELLVYKAIEPDPGSDPHERVVRLNLTVTKQPVKGDSEGQVLALSPDPPALITNPATQTNSNTVRLRGQVTATDIDGVERVWYKFSTSPTDDDVSDLSDGHWPTGTGWLALNVTNDAVTGKPGYSYSEKVNFPADDGTYYIHWFLETVNTKGSRGTTGPYKVYRHRPEPTITGPAAIGLSPFTATITFDYPVIGLDVDMFSVTNGSIGALTTVTAGTEYTLLITPDGSEGDVEVSLPANVVQDDFTNKNVDGAETFPYYDGIPVAYFSTIDTVYFTPSSVSFSVASGSGVNLYASDMTLIDNTNPLRAFTMQKDGAVFTPSVTYNPTGNIFEIATLAAGEYMIHIEADSIRNEIASGIKDTTYTFRVFDLNLGIHNDTHDFGTLFEGEAASPYSFDVINYDAQAAPGLSVAWIDGAHFTVNPSGLLSPALAGGESRAFTVAPRAGLLLGSYSDTLRIYYNGDSIPSAWLAVTFDVDKKPAPVMEIDYVNEVLIDTNAPGGGQYSFNHAGAEAVGASGWPIPEDRMVGDDQINEQIDATGSASFPDTVLIPPRPAAPAKVKGSDTGGTDWNDGTIAGVNDSMEYRLETDDQWLPVPPRMTTLEGLPPGTYLIRYKAIPHEAFSSIIATVTIRVSLTPIITREVNLPDVTGVISDPVPGTHYIDSSDDFGFTLQFGGSPLRVRTSRTVGGQPEELTGVPDGSGGYTYAIRQVKETVYIYIGPETVGNAFIDGASVWAYKGVIHVEVLQDDEIDVYAVTGRLVKRVQASEGVTSISVAPGVYIVVLKSGGVQKVIVN
jgi:hypothetical protein